MNELDLTAKELDELLKEVSPRRTVWDAAGLAWQRFNGKWSCTAHPKGIMNSKNLINYHGPIRLTDRLAPEPDHSMCARLVREKTVAERAMDVLTELYDDSTIYTTVATVSHNQIIQAFADAGLLKEDDDD